MEFIGTRNWTWEVCHRLLICMFLRNYAIQDFELEHQVWEIWLLPETFFLPVYSDIRGLNWIFVNQRSIFNATTISNEQQVTPYRSFANYHIHTLCFLERIILCQEVYHNSSIMKSDHPYFLKELKMKVVNVKNKDTVLSGIHTRAVFSRL